MYRKVLIFVAVVFLATTLLSIPPATGTPGMTVVYAAPAKELSGATANKKSVVPKKSTPAKRAKAAKRSKVSPKKDASVNRKKTSGLSRKFTLFASKNAHRIAALISGMRIFPWLNKHAPQLLFLAGSCAVIAAAFSFYSRRYESKRFMTTTRLSIMDKEVQRTCRYIEDHFSDTDLSPAKICAVLITGEAFLSALFEKELGLSVDNFILQVRINRSKIMMRQKSDITPAEVAAATGFTDTSNFLDRFKSVSGVDYTEYMNALHTGVPNAA